MGFPVVDKGQRLGDIRSLATAINASSGLLTQNAVTASAVETQAAGTPIKVAISRVTTAGATDAVTLAIKATAGASFVIINDSGQTVTLFPKVGDKLNDALQDAAVTIADNTISEYFCPVDGLWFGGATTLEA